jgi:flagellar biosynthesis protein FlhF
MKVKKYTASTMKEALGLIRTEMGEDALIISTRELTAPLGKKFVEVTAAAEEKEFAADKLPTPAPKPEEPERVSDVGKPDLEEQIVKNRVLLAETLKPLKEELFQLRTMVNELRRSGQRASSSVDLKPLEDEVRSLKRMFSKISKQADFDQLVNFPQHLKDLYHQLINNEVDESLSFNLIEMLNKQLTEDNRNDVPAIRTSLKSLIEGLVVAAKPVVLNQHRPTIMAFIGPTGVGKTTTIAKLAARCTLQMKKKVTLVTIDTYRIAAVEQLKTYAKIMDLPIFVCYSVDDMRRTINESRDSSLILIDTAGHSQTDSEQVKDLKNYFRQEEDIDVLLVLSATTKSNDLRDITERFSIVGADKLVFTKLDETTTYGPLLNETMRTKLPIGYFTTGQNVPDDIETATPAKLAKLIVN